MLPTILSRENITALNILLDNAVTLADGEFWECGVYNGGSASMIYDRMPKQRQLRLFDSFEGLPQESEHDNMHKAGDFNDANYDTVVEYFKDKPSVEINKGWIPDTFAGKDDCKIAFLHLDLDLYEGYLATLDFAWPKMVSGGIVAFDDYQAPSCLGARKAVDEFVATKGIKLHTDVNLPHAAWIIKD
jgi:O-methyltransferase